MTDRMQTEASIAFALEQLSASLSEPALDLSCVIAGSPTTACRPHSPDREGFKKGRD